MPKKSSIATIIIILGVIAVAATIIISKSLVSGSGVSSQLAQCIGSHSQVYVQLGCSHCTEQENLFGDNWQYVNATDCYYNPSACSAITQNGYYSTPTWIIKNQTYQGVQSVDKLKQLTGC